MSASIPPEINKAATAWASEGKNVLYVLRDGAVIGSLALEDEIRPQSWRQAPCSRKLRGIAGTWGARRCERRERGRRRPRLAEVPHGRVAPDRQHAFSAEGNAHKSSTSQRGLCVK